MSSHTQRFLITLITVPVKSYTIEWFQTKWLHKMIKVRAKYTWYIFMLQQRWKNYKIFSGSNKDYTQYLSNQKNDGTQA